MLSFFFITVPLNFLYNFSGAIIMNQPLLYQGYNVTLTLKSNRNLFVVAASLSFQYWDRECKCWFFFISTKFNGLIFNMEYDI